MCHQDRQNRDNLSDIRLELFCRVFDRRNAREIELEPNSFFARFLFQFGYCDLRLGLGPRRHVYLGIVLEQSLSVWRLVHA